MIGVHFGECGEFQESLFPDSRYWHDFLDLEVAPGQSARLVKHNGFDRGERVQEVRSLDQYASAGGQSDAAEVPQRDADHKRTGARDHQHHERAIDPGLEIGFGHEQGGQHRDTGRCSHDDRGVPPREAGDEVLRRSLSCRGVFNELKHLGNGGLVERLGHSQLQGGGQVDHARHQGIAHSCAQGNRLAGQGRSVQTGLAR